VREREGEWGVGKERRKDSECARARDKVTKRGRAREPWRTHQQHALTPGTAQYAAKTLDLTQHHRAPLQAAQEYQLARANVARVPAADIPPNWAQRS